MKQFLRTIGASALLLATSSPVLAQGSAGVGADITAMRRTELRHDWLDLRGPDAVDKHGILDAFLRGIRGCQFPFAQVAEEFRLIENAARTVYLPVGEGAALCEQLRSGHVTRTLLRKLGVYSVSCYKDQFDKLDAAGALELRPDGSAILTDTSCYSEKTGLAMDVETGIGLYF